MVFRVIRVIDGDTFDVEPNWQFNGEVGNRVRIAGMNAPEAGQPGASAATEQLKQKILHKNVLLSGKSLSYGRLVAEVHLA